jgi:hypothetical protein
MSLWTSTFLPDSLKGYNPAEDLRSMLEQAGADSSTPGHISFIQEGGCKARVVAVPNIWCQGMFQILDNQLSCMNRKLPVSCVHNQVRGANFLKEKLAEGTVYCYDLSSATDRFPLELQTAVLEGLGLKHYADAMHELVKVPFKVNTKVDGVPVQEQWSYKTGQPMGLYGSFHLFNLTHCLLLAVLCDDVGLKPEDVYRVIGDDVVITNSSVANLYKQCLEGLDVGVSPTKSIISDSLSEFAGFLAHKTNRLVTVYRPLKWSGKHGMGSAINIMFALSSKSALVSNWYRTKYETFKKTISWRNPDLSPIFTREDEGCGKTPSGLNSHLLGSLGNRFSYSLDFNFSETFFERYEELQLLLLGQKERVTASGFASANLNPMGIAIPDKGEDNSPSYGSTCMADPLMADLDTFLVEHGVSDDPYNV